MNYILSALLSGVLLWLCLATKVEAPKPQPFKPEIKQAALVVQCDEEHNRICRARKRLAEIKEKANGR